MLNLKNTLDGYLKNVEVIGNTTQDANNLADIRSVGDKVEGQELYKIDVVSCGKNLFDGELELGSIDSTDGSDFSYSQEMRSKNSMCVKPLQNIIVSYVGGTNIALRFYDKNKQYLGSNLDFYGSRAIRSGSTFVIPENAYYLRFKMISTDLTIKFQFEEGTQATPYEPYQEQKLEILSPVQLEKVKDVVDRIICKDGVWGIEKKVLRYSFQHKSLYWNVGEKLANSTRFHIQFSDLVGAEDIVPSDLNVLSSIICNKYITKKVTNLTNEDLEGIGISSSALSIRINNDKLSNITSSALNEYLTKASVYMLYQTKQPKFIPLPHDQQVKLRTFAGQTNIFFNTEIAGQIKAQVPKSLGATVNTHTEQIADLHNSLDRVKKLEETTVSTIETESNFTTVDATSNGYFEDVKLEGKTLVNLAPKYSINWVHKGGWESKLILGANNTGGGNHVRISQDLKPGTEYTVVINIKVNTQSGNIDLNNYVTNTCVFAENMWVRPGDIGIKTFKVKTVPDFTHINPSEMVILRSQSWGVASGETLIDNILLLEGDHTNNPPEYFEGLMSVGQDVEGVSVESVNENLFSKFTQQNINSSLNYYDSDTNTYVSSTRTAIDSFYTCIEVNGRSMRMVFDKEGEADIYYKYTTNKPSSFEEAYLNTMPLTKNTFISNDNCHKYLVVTFRTKTIGSVAKMGNISIIGDASANSYVQHQSNKKPLLYFNPTTETWEKPILREWDTIEKHSDDKYYYHKRSGEVVLNGSESWYLPPNQMGNNTILVYSNIADAKINQNYPICNLFAGTYLNIWEPTNDIEGILVNHNKDVMIRINKVKLSTQDEAGFKAWLKANPTTVVYQLAQEEVYECTNIDLMTYNGETNYIINSGAISPKSLLKVHNNISNVVKILQEKVSLLENTFIAGLKSVLSGDMYSLATILYPEDFEQNDNTEQDIMVIPE